LAKVINRGEMLGEHEGCAARVGATVIGRSGSFSRLVLRNWRAGDVSKYHPQSRR